MRALLLAAGIGARLRPLTYTTPKCLVPVCGRPLLDYWLDLLFCAGFERVLVNTHWLPDQVEAHIRRSPWGDRVDQVHEPILLGTAGTIGANRSYFSGHTFFAAHADNIGDIEVESLLQAHARRPAGCVMTMLAFRADDPTSCGILELDSRAVVTRFWEKQQDPPGNLANAAVYVLEPEVVDLIVATGASDFSTEIIPRLLGRILAVETKGYLRDVGTPESLQKANRDYNSPRSGVGRAAWHAAASPRR